MVVWLPNAWITLHELLRVPRDLSMIIKCTFGGAEVNRTLLNSSALANGTAAMKLW